MLTIQVPSDYVRTIDTRTKSKLISLSSYTRISLIIQPNIRINTGYLLELKPSTKETVLPANWKDMLGKPAYYKGNKLGLELGYRSDVDPKLRGRFGRVVTMDLRALKQVATYSYGIACKYNARVFLVLDESELSLPWKREFVYRITQEKIQHHFWLPTIIPIEDSPVICHIDTSKVDEYAF